MRKSILCLLLVFVLGFALIGTSCKDSGEDESTSGSQIESITGGESESYSKSDSDKTSESSDEGKLTVKDKSKTLFVGETYEIEPTSEGEFTYSSTDEEVAVVSDSGVVTAVSDGVAFVEVSNGKSNANVKINVIKSVEYIRLDANEVGFVKGGEKTIKAEVIKNGEISDDEVTFTCESEGVKLVKNGNTVTISASVTGYYTVVVACEDLKESIIVKVVGENAKMLGTTESEVENCVTLKWNAVENADGYKVMVNGGEWTDVSVTSLDVTEYTKDLKNGEKAVFAVRAVAKNNFGYLDGLSNRLIFSHDYAETVIEKYTCVKAGKVKYTCKDCGKEYEQDGVYADHVIENGACKVCGLVVTEKINYLYDSENECYYVGGTDAGFDSEEVYILAEYDDGKNGKHPVKYFGVNAFTGNDIIKKVVIPKAITEFKDVRGAYNNIEKGDEMLSSPLRGGTFDGCTNLEFVSMEGITVLPAIDSNVICDKDGNFVRIGEEVNITEEEKKKGFKAATTDYYHDTFRDCYKLTTLIVGNGFDNKGRSFMNWQLTPTGVSGVTDIYVNGEVKNIASESYPIGTPSGANNNLLSGDVFRYEQDSTKCFTWYYDANGKFVSNGKHEYNRSGVCKKCYALNDAGVKYVYYEADDCYYVGDNRIIDQAEIEILSEYDDGIHGLKPVTFVRNEAFLNNQIIRKVILPESVTTLDGGVFQGCSNLEYVSMTGIGDMAFKQIERPYGKVTTNNNFLNCFSLKAVIVGKDFNLYADSEDAQQFIGVGDEITVCVDIFVDAKKSVSDVNCGPSPKNNILTGRIYYKGDLKRCGEWTIDADENIVTSEKVEHDYENGICKNCGDYETYGVNYLFDEAKNVYYIASYTGKNPEMKVLGEYDDGEHGVKPVGYVKNSAFMDNSVITKVVFPESVKRLEGSVFQGCLNLEYVSMTGVEELTLENLSNSGIYDGIAYSTNNFLNCGKLKVVIVGKKFKITNNHFIRTDDSLPAGLADIYMSGTKAECEFIYSPTDKNEHLSGVVYYQGDLSRCQEWKFNADGTISTSAKSHNYVDDKCTNCGDYETHGVSYLYNESKGVYYVSGYIGSSAEVTILAKYDDGTHGEKDVTYIATSAFESNAVITKVILPDSIKSLDGSVFQWCSNLEYVSMTGVENLDYDGSALGYGATRGNNFMDCTALKYVILNPAFTTNCQQFFLQNGNPEKAILDIYVNAASGTPNFGGANTNLLTGNVYYKVDDTATVKCMQWNYGADGEIVKGKPAHEYDEDGKCKNCGTLKPIETYGVVYEYDTATGTYKVTGYNGDYAEVTVLAEYNDGTNGKAAVTALGVNAFNKSDSGNMTLVKVYLPDTVKTIAGDAFFKCYELEYVEMRGVEELGYGNSFLNCFKLTTVIVGKKFNLNGQAFKTTDGEAPHVSLYVDGTKAESVISAVTSEENNMFTGVIYYKVADDEEVKCMQWNYGTDGEIVKGASEHDYVDGKCSICGAYNTMGVAYGYDSGNNAYYVADNRSLNLSEVTILEKYNDGTNGEASVIYVQLYAFHNNTAITKVILPESVTELDGSVFMGCTNLEYVSMTGVKTLNYSESVTRPYSVTVDGNTYSTRFGNNNFRNCNKLKYVIMGSEFSTNCGQFNSEGVPNPTILEIFVNGAAGKPSFEGDNALWTGNVYYKVDDTATVKCLQWKFGENGEIVKGSASHNFVDGVCKNCGEKDAMGVTYKFYNGVYYVDSYGSTANETLTVFGTWDDGVNGVANVTFIKNGAFSGHTELKKVILHENITTLDGGVFAGCSNLEYVSMKGVEKLPLVWFSSLDHYGVYSANDVTSNNFLNCGKLTTVVVGKNFECGAQMFKIHNDDSLTACVNIYADGNESECNITLSDDQNQLLTNTIYYYSDTESENSWHYVNGVATKW